MRIFGSYAQFLTNMTQKDLIILDELLKRTEDLPSILHLRAAEVGYVLTEDDKKLLFDTYQKLDDILKELASFINIKFPGVERHIRAWNDIDFDTKVGNFKIVTTDRNHIKREWNKGMFDLKSLIKILKQETILLIDESESKKESFVKENNVNHFQGNIIYNENSNNSQQTIKAENETESKKNSWIEILSWIAGIIGVLITIYQLIK